MLSRSRLLRFTACRHIAQIFQALKKYKKAEVALLEARAIQREVLTTESTPYAETMFRLGQLYEE